MCVCMCVCARVDKITVQFYSHSLIVLCCVLIIDAGRFNWCVCVLNNAATVVLFSVATPQRHAAVHVHVHVCKCVRMNIHELMWLICCLFVKSRKMQDVLARLSLNPSTACVCWLLNASTGTDPEPFSFCLLCLRSVCARLCECTSVCVHVCVSARLCECTSV